MARCRLAYFAANLRKLDSDGWKPPGNRTGCHSSNWTGVHFRKMVGDGVKSPGNWWTRCRSGNWAGAHTAMAGGRRWGLLWDFCTHECSSAMILARRLRKRWCRKANNRKMHAMHGNAVSKRKAAPSVVWTSRLLVVVVAPLQHSRQCGRAAEHTLAS